MWRLMRDAQNDAAGAPLNTNTGIQKDGAGLIMARGAQKGDAGAPHRLSGAVLNVVQGRAATIGEALLSKTGGKS